eukprot:TRINITY_DN1712_c0_g6_i1.p1 TRINITY_DN1712_c0_g6~~TRINITY_DN1712_c0_g6_i1.p1  ORF type:complete len:592 (-),score=74.02 TRINITY_DN1712_c0_g6_i1:80-1756(-)
MPSASEMMVWRTHALFAFRLYCKLGLLQFLFRVTRGVFRRWRMMRMLGDVPWMRIPVHPIFGCIPSMIKNRKRLHEWRNDATLDQPATKLMGAIWDPDSVALFLRDPADIRHFLKDKFELYTSPQPKRNWLWKHFQRWLGDGIFVTKHGVGSHDKGKHWLQQRKIASGIFSRANFTENMQQVFIRSAKRVRDRFVPGQKVDLQAQFFNFTMDSITKIFFGEESNTVSGEQNIYGSAFDDAHRCFFSYFIESISFISFAQLLPWPFGGIHGVCGWLHTRLSPTYRMFIENVTTLDLESAKFIEKCWADPKRSERTDLLALFAQATEKEGMSASTSTKFLRDVVLNFVIAGRDTTACLLSWTFYVLCMNPELQRRVAEEVDRILPGDTEPTLKLLHHSSMPLLHALIFEVLRLHPPVPVDSKESQCEDVLPSGIRVPKFTRMTFMPWSMGRDASVWPDPEEVRLERWIPFKQPAPHEFPVFLGGPRICLGQDMAIFEAKLVCAMLLQDFSFTLLPGEAEKIHYSPLITMSICNSKDQDSHQLWIIPERRHRQDNGIGKKA